MRISRRFSLALAAVLAVGACDSATEPVQPSVDLDAAVQETAEPGTRPVGFDVSSAAFDATTFDTGDQIVAAAGPLGGINPEVTETGNITVSIDGAGTTGSSASFQVDKPAGATVRGAYMAAASTGFCNCGIANGQMTLNGAAVNWDKSVPSDINSNNYWADVTSLVKATLDAAAPGIVNITVTESNSFRIDGSILAVIFDDPGQATVNTVSLLFGAQKIAGDDFFLGLSDPLDTSLPGLTIDLSLGISFGAQGNSQVSFVDVKGTRMTSSAGGQDDGQLSNGALITVGGVGDSNANPAPFASPNGNHRYDDELYNLIPFLADGDQVIPIHTRNPSNDDNIFFAALFATVEAVVVTQDPAANAGPDQTVELPATFDLDGSASFDPDGSIVEYAWFEGATPLGLGATITGLSRPVGTYTFTLVVTDNDGLTDDDQVTITVLPPADVTPPAISYALSGAEGDNGWYVGPVTIEWTVTDPETAVTSTSGCETVTTSADGTGYTFTCSATSTGGTASVTSDPFMIDQTAPAVSSVLVGTLGDNGWYVSPVTVDWTVTDGGSGVATDCADVTQGADGMGFQESCTATDNAGNSASADSDEFMIDQTDPTLSFSGNAGTYDVAATVDIFCAAADATSGVASATCPEAHGAAWTFGLGATTLDASATDNAGNDASASTSFTVTVSYDGLCALVEAFVSHQGVANSLCVKLAAASRADDRGNDNARDGSLNAFINEVQAQAGKKVPADKAPILSALAQALMD